MIIFRNFKDQLRRFILYLGILKTNQSVLLYLVSCINMKTLKCNKRRVQCTRKKKKSKLTPIIRDKKRLRISLKVLEVVKEYFPDTKNFIDDTMEEQCQKEQISVEEVIFYKSIIFACVLFRFSLVKVFLRFFTNRTDQKKQFLQKMVIIEYFYNS